MFGNIGAGELIVIIAVLVAVFGKRKATEIARDVGEVRKEIEKMGQESQQAVEELKKPINLSPPAQELPAEGPSEKIKKEEVESKEKGGDQKSA